MLDGTEPYGLQYISAGGNRHSATADWDKQSGLLAFGADHNIALWNPLDPSLRGVHALLPGHTDVVNVTKFFPTGGSEYSILLSGAADKTIRVWCNHARPTGRFTVTEIISDHGHAINTITVCSERRLFVSGSADATVKIWKLTHHWSEGKSLKDEGPVKITVELQQSIDIVPKFLPLAVAMSTLPGSRSLILAVAGTKAAIAVYVSDGTIFKLRSTLTGHEGWVRSLAFVHEPAGFGVDVLLASASQDKFVRLWRLHRGEELPAATNAAKDPAFGALGRSLSNKAHRFQTEGIQYSLTFEALLLGHEDWIYSARWCSQSGELRLLTASADNSLAIWRLDLHSGLWICNTRLGEISMQKGATTATGSTGGFWTGLWSPEGDAVVSLSRTGSWRLWELDEEKDEWCPGVSISGHVQAVQDLAWSRDGSYLLSTGSDQTTRLFAPWNHDTHSSWHECSRPQIHGYDLNCIDTINDTQFISGADEKLLRVFDQPKAVAGLLQRVCGLHPSTNGLSIEAADIPVLGLSNKAVESVADVSVPESLHNGSVEDQQATGNEDVIRNAVLHFDHPPLEDHLARHLLWPETEKLYGHGYEISAVAASHDGTLVATACKASSTEHAVIRLYETKGWREIKPPLTAHSLTVTSLAFSPDDCFLLSTGRDRKWTIFGRTSDTSAEYQQTTSDPKSHARMVLAGQWAPTKFGYMFVTGARDKSVKIWSFKPSEETKTICKSTILADSPVTAVDILQNPVDEADRFFILAYGTEEGKVVVHQISEDFDVSSPLSLAREVLPSRAVNQLRWQPHRQKEDSSSALPLLAAGSADCSLRLYWFSSYRLFS
ncbi:MAG: hypothetical protein M1822_002033 [Bathelium mastoideum]|nr:MAG: hypothetical protein M1822_002033 [Bathelium mastoideum]